MGNEETATDSMGIGSKSEIPENIDLSHKDIDDVSVLTFDSESDQTSKTNERTPTSSTTPTITYSPEDLAAIREALGEENSKTEKTEASGATISRASSPQASQTPISEEEQKQIEYVTYLSIIETAIEELEKALIANKKPQATSNDNDIKEKYKILEDLIYPSPDNSALLKVNENSIKTLSPKLLAIEDLLLEYAIELSLRDIENKELENNTLTAHEGTRSPNEAKSEVGGRDNELDQMTIPQNGDQHRKSHPPQPNKKAEDQVRRRPSIK